MSSTYIFDLDGTLALTHHRQHILYDKNNPHRWDNFFRACVDDEPNTPVISTMEELYAAGNTIWIWSGRSASVWAETHDWFRRYIQFQVASVAPYFCMRPIGDMTPDDQLKEKWLHNLRPQDRDGLVAVFDDRQKVVDMWRRNGLTCFQVAPGDF